MSDPIIHLTPKAIESAKKQLAKRGTPEAYLRLGLKGGACSGYEYVIQFEDEKRARDLEFDFDELRVLVDYKSIVLLNNSILDYESGLMKGGFKFINPAATSVCGCGKSFAADIEANEVKK